MSDQLQDPWDEIEAEMRGALLGGKIPLLGDCQRHRREIWRHTPCPMCERDAVIGRLTAVLDAARELRDFESTHNTADGDGFLRREELLMEITEAVCAYDAKKGR